MTKVEKEKLWASYESGVRLACSFFTTGDFGVAKEIFYTASAFMRIENEFDMYGNKPLRQILNGYDIDLVRFINYMSGVESL